MAKIYTKTGDKGFTSLLGGTRVKKSNIQIESYGTLDELNAFVGLLKSKVPDEEIVNRLTVIQGFFLELGAFLASDGKTTKDILSNEKLDDKILMLENEIDVMQHNLPEQKQFVIPGAGECEAYSHVCRTVCRRLERILCDFPRESEIEEKVLVFVNRLSDFFFVLGRFLLNSKKCR